MKIIIDLSSVSFNFFILLNQQNFSILTIVLDTNKVKVVNKTKQQCTVNY